MKAAIIKLIFSARSPIFGVLLVTLLVTLAALQVAVQNVEAQQSVVEGQQAQEPDYYDTQQTNNSETIQLFPSQSFLSGEDQLQQQSINEIIAEPQQQLIFPETNDQNTVAQIKTNRSFVQPGLTIQKQEQPFVSTAQPEIQKIQLGQTQENSFIDNIFAKISFLTVIAVITALVAMYLLLSIAGRNRRKKQDELLQFQLEKEELEHEIAYHKMLTEADNRIKLVYDSEDNILMFGTAPKNSGIPEELDKIELFYNWLNPISADRIIKLIQELRNRGEEFNTKIEAVNKQIIYAQGRVMENMCCAVWIYIVPEEQKKISQQKKQIQVQNHMIQTLSQAIKEIGVATWIRDDNGKIVWVNEPYIKIVAQKLDEMNLRNVIEKQAEIITQKQLQNVTGNLNSDKKMQHKIKYNVNKQERYFQITETVNEKGGSIGTATDISEIYYQNNNNNNTNKQIFDNIQDAIISFGKDKRLIIANEMFVKYTNINRKFLNEKPYITEIFDKMRELNCLPEEKNYTQWVKKWIDNQGVQNQANQSQANQSQVSQSQGVQNQGSQNQEVQSPGSQNQEVQSLGVQNQEVQSQGVNEKWYLQNGRKFDVKKITHPNEAITIVICDITQSLELSGQIDEITELQAETLNNLREAVVQFGADGRVKLCNTPFREMFLKGMDEKREPHINDIENNAKDKINEQRHFEIIKKIVLNINTKEKYQGEQKGTINFKNGKIYSFNARMVHGGTKLVTYNDQTDMIKYQKVLRQTNQELEKTSSMKKEFMAQVSQKLRQPLNALMAYSQMLDVGMHGPLNPEQAKLVASMASEFNSLKVLVDTIIDKAQIDSGVVRLRLKLSSVRTLIDCALQAIRNKAKNKNVKLDVILPKKELNIIADPVNLTKIIISLLSDSIDYSTKGNNVRLKCFEEQDAVQFEIIDECPFVTQKNIYKTPDFEIEPKNAAMRIHSITYQIASGLVQMHGGKIKMKSSFGKNGTIVSFNIPIPKSGNMQKAS